MQPVISDLKILQDRWNNQPLFKLGTNQKEIEQTIHLKERPAYLRVLDVAILTFAAFTISASFCFTLSGVFTVISGGNVFFSFAKLIIGGLSGIISYDLVRLRFITDRCRSVFREATRSLEAHKVTDKKIAAWNKTVAAIEHEYRALIIVDTALDAIYPVVVNH